MLVVIDEHTLGLISAQLDIERTTMAYHVVGPPPLPLRANILHSSILRGGHLSSGGSMCLIGHRVRLATHQDTQDYGYQASKPGEGFQDANWYAWDTRSPEEAAAAPILLGSTAWPADSTAPPNVPSATPATTPTTY